MGRGVARLLLLGMVVGPLTWGPLSEAGTHDASRPSKVQKKPLAGERGSAVAESRRRQPVTIDADEMESLKKEGLVIFTGNVIARQDSSVHYADRMEVYLDERDEKVHRIVSSGHVKIMTKDCRVGTARRAEYYDDEQKVLLIGNARVWQEDNIVTGERITIFLAEERSVVQKGPQGRVQAIFYPKSEEGKRKESSPTEDGRGRKAGAPPCP